MTSAMPTCRTIPSGRVRYLRLKDVDAGGSWRMLGHGRCDTGAVKDLVSTAPQFNGWLVLEEESDEAARDPGKAVSRNRESIKLITGF